MQTVGDYSQYMAVAFAGMDNTASHMGKMVYSLLNSGAMAKQTIANATVGGTIGTETFTSTYVGTSPTYGAFTRTISYTATSGQTAAQVATAIAALVNADEYLNDVLTAGTSTAAVTHTIRYFNQNPITSVTNTASGSATFTASPTVTNYTAAAGINFGYAVGQYSTDDDDECQAITTSTNLTIAGIAISQHLYEQSFPPATTGIMQYPANSVVQVMRRGLVWVPVAAAVTRNTVPAVLNATGQLTATGAGSSTALTGAIYRTTQATAGGLALVEINLP